MATASASLSRMTRSASSRRSFCLRGGPYIYIYIYIYLCVCVWVGFWIELVAALPEPHVPSARQPAAAIAKHPGSPSWHRRARRRRSCARRRLHLARREGHRPALKDLLRLSTHHTQPRLRELLPLPERHMGKRGQWPAKDRADYDGQWSYHGWEDSEYYRQPKGKARGNAKDPPRRQKDNNIFPSYETVELRASTMARAKAAGHRATRMLRTRAHPAVLPATSRRLSTTFAAARTAFGGSAKRPARQRRSGRSSRTSSRRVSSRSGRASTRIWPSSARSGQSRRPYRSRSWRGT